MTGGWLHDTESVLPAGPPSRQDDPQPSVTGFDEKSALSEGAIQHTNLVAQRQILQSEIALRFQERPGGRR